MVNPCFNFLSQNIYPAFIAKHGRNNALFLSTVIVLIPSFMCSAHSDVKYNNYQYCFMVYVTLKTIINYIDLIIMFCRLIFVWTFFINLVNINTNALNG